MRYLILALCFSALLFTSCRTPSTPGMCVPTDPRLGAAAVGGISGKSEPKTGYMPGVPGLNATYTRGGIGTFRTRFDPKSRQAGSITNPKALSAATSAAAIPLSARCASEMLDVAATKWAKAATPEQEKTALDGLMKLLEHVAKTQKEYLETVIQMAPNMHDFVAIFLDASGSSTDGSASGSGTGAFDPENAKMIREGLPELMGKAQLRLKELKAESAARATAEEKAKGAEEPDDAPASSAASSAPVPAPAAPDAPEPTSGGGE